MSDPKTGMRYEDVRKRVKRIMATPGDNRLKSNLVNSLLNQASLCEGDGASREIVREVNRLQR